MEIPFYRLKDKDALGKIVRLFKSKDIREQGALLAEIIRLFEKNLICWDKGEKTFEEVVQVKNLLEEINIENIYLGEYIDQKTEAWQRCAGIIDNFKGN